MRDPNQVFIYSDEELSLIKNTFAEGETLLYTVRKALLQFPLSGVEKGLLVTAITPDVVRVLKKRMLPDLGDEYPIRQLSSLLTGLTDDLKLLTPREIAPKLAAKKLEIDYLTQQFAVLANPEEAGTEKIKLAGLAQFTGDETDDYVNFTAYIFLLGFIDPMLGFIKSIAGQKSETIEQQKLRMKRDSNQ